MFKLAYFMRLLVVFLLLSLSTEIHSQDVTDIESNEELIKELVKGQIESKNDKQIVIEDNLTQLNKDIKEESLDKEDENNENSDPRLAALGLRKILNSSYKNYSSDINIYEKKLVKLGVAEIGGGIKPGEIFPIEANLDYLNGIDFQKGCFIGQEVCSRMYRKGKVKKRIVSFKSNDNFTNNDELVYNDRTIGTVIKKIEDYGIALIKIDKLINPEREKITITSKTEKKNIEINLPKFFPV